MSIVYNVHQPPRTCDSCGDPLRPNRIYVGFIGTTHPIHVCEPCAAWHSSGRFVLCQIATAQQIIRGHHAQLNRLEVAL